VDNLSQTAERGSAQSSLVDRFFKVSERG